MTQLKPIDDIVGVGGVGRTTCPRARDEFDHILYLPVTGESFSSKDRAALIDALAAAVTSSVGGEDQYDGVGRLGCMPTGEDGRSPRPPRSRMDRVAFFSIAVALNESHFSILGLWRIIPVRVALQLVIAITPWICTAQVCTALLLLVRSQYMGPIYLK